MSVHPTAIIHPEARLDVSVKVGPYCIIDGDVQIGAETRIASGVRIHDGVRIGRNNRIDDHVVLGTEPQDLSFDPSVRTGLIIGEGNHLREAVNISRSTRPDQPTVLGDGNYLMGNFHIGHDCLIGDHNIFTHASVLAGFVNVGDRVVVSGLVAVHQFCRIGDLAMLSGCSRINKDVPPFSVAEGVPTTLVGLNSVGMKRAGLEFEARLAIKRTYERLARSVGGIQKALSELRETERDSNARAIIDFYANSRRGVTAHRRMTAGEGELS